ncbi:unnamed protein product (macronuclear) [Paramecium tetraurelia]|uniref:CCT domain-containing protein n=1 Tax=Paramecium tetraurelia TaxID=5888 RepID=A0C5K6_PARTE|nr:uncharacterized protein GSPATT00035202001 [Paramecium tetraurelia]CAK66073.1 unnamed protein product [Paramecium tetraurelia]|eukprot:XP_001433470.1 hypothetical protein (macronuclear) [Paramecium tetraurelia strain d4-2]
MFQVQYDVISEFEQDRNNSFQDEESNINIFTQHQLGLFKKPSYFVESEEFNLKNNCECSTAEQTESSEHSDNSFEDIPSPKFPSKQLPPPINADQHLFNLEMNYYPSISQENFLLNFINQEDLQRIKIGLDYKILDDPQTLKFENWVQQLCNTKANQKEMQRKLKVKKYLEKKHSRTSFEKKVHYQIRQKVAEERLRIKGRFVTWKQAIKMLEKSDTKREWTNSDYFKIKILLNEKYGQ